MDLKLGVVVLAAFALLAPFAVSAEGEVAALQKIKRDCAPQHPVAEMNPLPANFIELGVAESKAAQECESKAFDALLPPLPSVCEGKDEQPTAVIKQCIEALEERNSALARFSAARPSESDEAFNRIESEYRQNKIMLDYYLHR